MTDIKLTLSSDKTKRAPNIEAELKWLREEGRLWYPLGRNRPLRAEPGCWVYFVRGGQLVARARVDAIEPPSDVPKQSYTGAETNRGSWEIAITELELARLRCPHKGFQGFRYVTPDEQSDFEAAFIS